MMTVSDIHNVTFEKSMRGYRADEVDDFLNKVALEFESLVQELDEATKTRDDALAQVAQVKEDSDAKLAILGNKIEQYRADEENLKVALLNAQRLGETVVSEAKQKADTIISDAKRTAKQLQLEAQDKISQQELQFINMQAEVTKFKTDIMGRYKKHLELLAAIPVPETKKQQIVFSSEAQAAEPASKPKKRGSKVVDEPAPATEQQDLFNDTKTDDAGSFENYRGVTFEE